MRHCALDHLPRLTDDERIAADQPAGITSPVRAALT
jgi:hypothetical protein